MTALAVAALEDAGRPLTLTELADEVVKRGYTPLAEPKNPLQLGASLSALPHKGTAIRRVGHGLYGLPGRDRRGYGPRASGQPKDGPAQNDGPPAT